MDINNDNIVGKLYFGYESDPPYYYWGNEQDKFVSLQLTINGNLHLGWLGSNVTSFFEWIIKDYASNSTPNTPVQAGQTVLNMEE